MLKIMQPTALTSAMLVSASVPENDYPAWSATTSYTAGARVIRTTTHRIYQAVADITGNASNTTPEADTPHVQWVEIAPTNRWAMFDQRVASRSVGTSSGLSVQIQPGRCNGVALMDMVYVSDFTLEVVWAAESGITKDETTDYAYGITLRTIITATQIRLIYTANLRQRNVSNWKEYFLEPYAIKTDAFIGFASRNDATITLTVPAPGVGEPVPEIGAFMFGNFIELGDVGRDADAGAESYTVIQTDDWGISQIVERDYVKRVTYPVLVYNYGLNRLFSTLAELQSKPAVFVGSDDFRYTPYTVYGVVESFNVGGDNGTASICNVNVKGIQL